MKNSTDAKKTILYDFHKSKGAKFGRFGEYNMPLWYEETGIKKEHLSVISNAGLFDTSHMDQIMISGKDALSLINLCCTRDLLKCFKNNTSALSTGKCVYSAVLDHNGWLIDDAIIYRFSSETYMIVVNAGMGDKLVNHFIENNKYNNASVKNISASIGKIDLQGPFSAKIMEDILFEPKKVLCDMEYFSFKGTHDIVKTRLPVVLTKKKEKIILSRTGYTGEFGYEIYADKSDHKNLWYDIIKAGKKFNLVCCGLASRDSLRTGAMLPLSQKDIGSWLFINNPWDFVLPFKKNSKEFSKEFIGMRALQNPKKVQYTYPFAGFDLKKVMAGENSFVYTKDNEKAGRVLTCVSEMAISRENSLIFSIASKNKPEGFKPKGVVCGFILIDRKAENGDIFYLKDKRRKIKVEIVNNIRPARTAMQAITE